MNDLAYRSTVDIDDDATIVTVDGKRIMLHRDFGGGWWIGDGDQFTRQPSGSAASCEYRRQVDAALRQREARRQWERTFCEWLLGCQMYDDGAPESACATAGQRRGWHEQQAYREQGGWRVEDEDGEYEWVGVYAPVTVDNADLIPY